MVLARGEDGYAQARRASVWNARTPDRYPDAIVVAESEHDVVRAVLDARERGTKIGVRPGGHSRVGNHVRDGGSLLDVSRLRSIELDVDAMTAAVGPGCHGDELLNVLGQRQPRRAAARAIRTLRPRSTTT